MNAILANFNDFKAKQATRALTASALQAINPHLVPISDKVGALVAAAKNMRIELKAAFPSIKFSVKSKSYSMGNSIDVCWPDGPITSQVKAIIGKYAAGRFDGMTDSYDYTYSTWKDAFGETKFIGTDRQNSTTAIESAIRTVVGKYNLVSVPTIADYESGALRCVQPDPCWNDDLAAIIGRTAQNRTWTLTKAPSVQIRGNLK